MYFTRHNLLVISKGAEYLRSHLRLGLRVHVIESIIETNVFPCSKIKKADTILLISFEVRLMSDNSIVLRICKISKRMSSGRLSMAASKPFFSSKSHSDFGSFKKALARLHSGNKTTKN